MPDRPLIGPAFFLSGGLGGVAHEPENIDTTFAGGNIYPVGVLRGLCPLSR